MDKPILKKRLEQVLTIQWTGDNINAIKEFYNGTVSVRDSTKGEFNFDVVRSQEDWFTSVDDFAQNANIQFSKNGVGVTVKEIYFFDTLKEMHRWLSE